MAIKNKLAAAIRNGPVNWPATVLPVETQLPNVGLDMRQSWISFHQVPPSGALDEFYRVAFRKKIYATIEELQRDLDEWLEEYNTRRAHQGKRCEGRTPYATLADGKAIVEEKRIAA